MNIIHLEASTGWGGQEIRILKEAIAMRSMGHHVYFACMKNACLAKKAREAGFIVYELNFYKKHWFFTLFKLLSIYRSHKISIVNTHSSLDAWIGGIAARIYGCKIVRTRHISNLIHKGINSSCLYGFLADFVVTTCEEVVQMISKASGKSLSKIKSIPTGVDFEKISENDLASSEFRKEYNISPDAFLVGCCCVMRSWKGIDVFLNAAAALKEEKNLVFCIVGGGHEETYRAQAKKLGLESNVIFTGHLDNPFPAMQAFDVFCLLSTKNEGVSQAILQAAYLKRPLIATPTGGLKEVCLHEETGLEVPIFDMEATKNAILRLYHDRDLAKKLGINANKRVFSHFTFDATIKNMNEVYNSLISSL